MTGRRQLAKQRTRDRIAEVATALFFERGFDEVTVAEVAAAAGVTKMTVFAHFSRKEDLLLDLAPEAHTLLRDAVQDRPAGADPVQALRRLALDLAEERHPLSGLADGSEPFLRTVASSPALLARAFELATELEHSLGAALAHGPRPPAHPHLLAALTLAAYRTVLTETSRRMMDGQERDALLDDHRRRLRAAFDALDAAARALSAEDQVRARSGCG